MQTNQLHNSAMNENQLNMFFQAECRRKESLLKEFEKIATVERRRKNFKRLLFQKKYERVTKGLFFVHKKTGDHVHLLDIDGEKFGVLQVTPEVSQFLHINDGLEGVFGFRNGYWRVQFLNSLSSSTNDKVSKLESN